MSHTVKTTGEPRIVADHTQRQSAKAAIAREMVRFIDPSEELLQLKIAYDKAASDYRDAVRDEAMQAIKRQSDRYAL